MCAGACTSVSSRLSVNSSNHSGRSRKGPSASRLSSVFLLLFCFFFGLIRTTFVGPVRHALELDLLTDLAMSMLMTKCSRSSSRSRGSSSRSSRTNERSLIPALLSSFSLSFCLSCDLVFFHLHVLACRFMFVNNSVSVFVPLLCVCSVPFSVRVPFRVRALLPVLPLLALCCVITCCVRVCCCCCCCFALLLLCPCCAVLSS